MMKIVLFVFSLLIVNSMAAQTYPAPEFDYQPCYVKGNSALSLDKVEGRVDDKPGFGGITQYLIAFGAKSTVRFKKDSIPTFLLRVEMGVDPSDVLELVKAQMKGERRRFEQFSMSIYGKSKDPRKFIVPITFKKVADLLYQIQIADGLQPGEYAFTIINESRAWSQVRGKLFCFGVD